jgi:hypothetical protein
MPDLSQLPTALVPCCKYPAIPILLLILALPACAMGADKAILEVLNPVASMEVKQVEPVPRLTTLDNKRILLYYNGKINSNVAVGEVQKQLEKRVAGSKFKIVAGSAWGPEKGFYDEIVAWKPDAVISSTAD